MDVPSPIYHHYSRGLGRAVTFDIHVTYTQRTYLFDGASVACVSLHPFPNLLEHVAYGTRSPLHDTHIHYCEGPRLHCPGEWKHASSQHEIVAGGEDGQDHGLALVLGVYLVHDLFLVLDIHYDLDLGVGLGQALGLC